MQISFFLIRSRAYFFLLSALRTDRVFLNLLALSGFEGPEISPYSRGLDNSVQNVLFFRAVVTGTAKGLVFQGEIQGKYNEKTLASQKRDSWDL